MPAVTLLQDKTANPLALDVLLTSNFGEEYRMWEPETLWQELSSLGTVASTNRVKIQAVRSLFVSQTPLTNIAVFQFVSWGLVGLAVDQTLLVPLSPEALVFSVAVINSVYKDDVKFHTDVEKYMCACLLEAGFIAPPPQLLFLKDEFSAVNGSQEVEYAILAANSPQPGSKYEIQKQKIEAVTAFFRDSAAALAEQLRS